MNPKSKVARRTLRKCFFDLEFIKIERFAQKMHDDRESVLRTLGKEIKINNRLNSENRKLREEVKDLRKSMRKARSLCKKILKSEEKGDK